MLIIIITTEFQFSQKKREEYQTSWRWQVKLETLKFYLGNLFQLQNLNASQTNYFKFYISDKNARPSQAVQVGSARQRIFDKIIILKPVWEFPFKCIVCHSAMIKSVLNP